MSQSEPAKRAWPLNLRAVPLATLLMLASVHYATGGGPAKAHNLVHASSGSQAGSALESGAPARPLAIEPMTTIGPEHSGYFEDSTRCASYPRADIERRFSPARRKAIMSCRYPLASSCFLWTPATVDAGSLRADMTAAGVTITNFQNLKVFQDDAGEWDAALATTGLSPDALLVGFHRLSIATAMRRQKLGYLLQSQHSRWPNYTGGQVIGPGAASGVQGPGFSG